jgi:hypothetical protein
MDFLIDPYRHSSASPVGPEIVRLFVYNPAAGAYPTSVADLIAEKNSFVALLSSYGTATLEELALSSYELSIPAAVTGLAGMITITSYYDNTNDFPSAMAIDNSMANGRFNVTPGGAKFVESGADLAKRLVFTPSVARSAFAFFAMDIGDFPSAASIVVNTSTGVLTYPVVDVVGDQTLAVFFGIALTDGRTISSVELRGTNEDDSMGVDDLITGSY